MPKACAIVCVKMVLDFFKAGSPDIDTLIANGDKERGYSKWGWLHDYEVGIFKRYGLSSHREEKMGEAGIGKLKGALSSGNPVIVSVINYLLERTRFHQVVLVGFEEEKGIVSGFYYHDPATTGDEQGAYLFCPIDKFIAGWRGMAIFIGQ